MLSSFVRNPLPRVFRLVRQYELLVLFVGINAAISWYAPRHHRPPLRRLNTIGCWHSNTSNLPNTLVLASLEEILAEKNYTTVNVLEDPKRAAKPEERNAFMYLRARCPKLVDVRGARSHFQICDVGQIREGFFHGTAVSSYW